MNTKKSKKIFVLLPTASGHINPTTGIISELTKNNVDVIFYASEPYRQLIEKTGATYREYSHPFIRPRIETVKEATNSVFHLLTDLLSFSDKVIPGLIEDVERDQPDLILYDVLSLHTKFTMNILENRYKKKISNVKPPKVAEICSSFATKDGIYPTPEDLKLFTKDNNFWGFFLFLKVFILQVVFSFKFGLDIFNPMRFFLSRGFDCPSIVTILPEFQPKRELFDDSYKFVGCCVAENVRNYAINDDAELKQVIDSFEAVNPLDSVESRPKTTRKLVYASLGTVFNNNILIFEDIIEALKSLETLILGSECELRVILSVGSAVYKQFQHRFEHQGYKVPSNYVIRESVPQIEILKRASVFITHCGMNSCSEAVHYGVPVICIPLTADQPINARRFCDELKLGKKFDPLNISRTELSDSVREVVYDHSYLDRILKLSKISRKNNGNVNGCREILNYLEGDEKKNN